MTTIESLILPGSAHIRQSTNSARSASECFGTGFSALKESLKRLMAKIWISSNSKIDSSSKIQITERIEDAVPIVLVTGAIDLNTSPLFRAFLSSKVSQKTPKLLLDFSGVTCIDATGLATLIEYLTKAQPFEGKLALAALSSRVKGAFEIMHLEQIFFLHSDIAAGLSALKVWRGLGQFGE
jgi:anti-anti-sigma factor